MSKLGADNEPVVDRLRPDDWRDKYRWPDAEHGWSGPLAGYPPDHAWRRKCEGKAGPIRHIVTETPEVSVTDAPLVTKTSKGGRPKSERRMTAAEKMAAYRARKKAL